MSGKEPVFRWDAYGISAYDARWSNVGDTQVINGINSKKFVRFDKNGIYGINDVPGIDGAAWHPSKIEDIDPNATFALTWEGLKVTNSNQATLRIGDGAKIPGKEGTVLDTCLLKITDKEGNTTFAIREDGTLAWGAGSTATKAQYSVDGVNNWHDAKNPEDYFVKYSYDGGNTWGEAIQIQGRDGKDGTDGVDAITYIIESSAGTLFEEGQTGTTILTARVYKGSVELEGLTYAWYINGSRQEGETSKTLEIDIDDIKNAEVYFEASEA